MDQVKPKSLLLAINWNSGSDLSILITYKLHLVILLLFLALVKAFSQRILKIFSRDLCRTGGIDMKKKKKQKLTIKGTVHSKHVSANFVFDTECFVWIVLFAVLCIVILLLVAYFLKQFGYPNVTISSNLASWILLIIKYVQILVEVLARPSTFILSIVLNTTKFFAPLCIQQ